MTPEYERPRCCPEPRCTPLYQLGDSIEAAGESFSCFGRMERPIVFVYDGVDHTNDLNSCHYTPLKGLIRWIENVDDWRMLSRAYATAAAALAREFEEGTS